MVQHPPAAYRGERHPATDELIVTVEDDTGRRRPLTHVVLHSPDGYEIAYEGSGPADLALSILADYLEERPTGRELYEGRSLALRHHQDFKRRFLAPLPRYEPFSIPASEVRAFLRARNLDPDRPSWFRVFIPSDPAARAALFARLYAASDALLDAAESAPDARTKNAIQDAAYELSSALEVSGAYDDD